MKTRVNRRNFLRLSATTGAGLFFASGTARSAIHKTVEKSDKLPTRILGRTGIEVPILSMGVMRADNPNVVRAAYNAGIFHFDTAHGYQNGKNEELLGRFFKDKPRESFLIATKVKSKYPLEDSFEKDLEDKLKLSLERLQMDFVDIFYSHAFDNVDIVKDQRMINALKKIKEEGKARFLGFSTHAHKPEQINAAIEAGIYDVILLSYNFKLKNLNETEEAIEKAAKAGIGLVVMKSMTGGVEDAEGKKVINAQACLKWVWQNKYITTIIPGFTNFEQLDDCLAAAANTQLTEEEQKYIAWLQGEQMMFCQQCETCVGQCTHHLPIPDIMRAYMYTYGYKYPSLSKETLLELGLNMDMCNNCSSCNISCPSGFNVAQKIKSISPVLQVPDEFLA